MVRKTNPPRPEKFEIVFNKLKENFSIVSCDYKEHFSGLIGYIEKITINFQGQSLALLLVETNNDVQIRLFDTDQPEKYYVSELWVKDSKLRSGQPFLFNWKCFYSNPKKESWCDIQLPLHKINHKTKAVVFKVFGLIEDIEKALLNK